MINQRILRTALFVTAALLSVTKGAPTEVPTPSPSPPTSALFPWPKDPSAIFEKITNLPREDVVSQIKAVVEPVTKDTLTQLTPDFLRSFANKPKDEMVEYVSGVLPAPKTVVSGVHSILSPAGDLLSPAAKSIGALLAELAGRSGNSTETSTSTPTARKRPNSAIRAAATAAANRAIRLAINTVRTILSVAFEPLKVEHVSVLLDKPQLQGFLKLDNVEIHNVSSFVLESIDVDPAQTSATFSATVQQFNVTGRYDIDCNVTHEGQHRVYGGGNFTVNVRNLTIDGSVQLGIRDLFLHVDDLKLSVSVGEIKLEMERLLEDDAISFLASGVASDVFPHFLDEYRSEVGAILSAQVANHVNELLSIFSIPMILERLKVGGEDVLAARMRTTTMPPTKIADSTEDPRIDKEDTEEVSLSKPIGSKEETGESEEDLRRMWGAEMKKHALWLEEQARRKERT